jgi:hypothetical protein
MTKIRKLLISFLLLSLFQGKTIAQEWEFAKEEDGIKVYTCHENGSANKSFRGETDITATLSSVSALIQDVEKFDEWDEDVTEIEVLKYEKDKLIDYYVVYDVPWPFQDRDLCVSATVTSDQETGTVTIVSSSIPDAVPVSKDNIRITDYRQKWIIQPEENGVVKVTVEGYADPAGSIPAWVANMAITKTPLNMLRSIRDHFTR